VTRRFLFVFGLALAAACNSTSSSSSVASAVRSPDTLPPKQAAPPEPEPAIPLPPIPPADPRELVIAAGVRQMLETEHLLARAIDDEVSRKAAARFVERLDPGKLFLLKAQVDELMRRADRLDDELGRGDLRSARLGAALQAQQRAKVATMIAELLAKPFDLNKDEHIETDSDKRDFVESDEALRDRWRKNLKLQVLQRMARMERATEVRKELAEAEKKKGKAEKAKHDGDKADKVEELPTTDEGREKKARADMATQYEGRFKRLSTARPLESVEAFVNAITGVFDPHTLYMAPDEQENFDIQISGSLEGIGAVLTEDDHYIEIREIVPGGAAWRQGELESGDLILSVKQAEGDTVDVADMRLSEVVKLIRGPKGTLVTLGVRKPDDRVLAIEIERDVVVVEASYARGATLEMGKGKAKFGYIYLPGFYGNTRSEKGDTPERNAVQDVRKLLQHFSAKKVGGVLLDLRGNGGGLLSQAKDISGLFIEQGPIVEVRGSRDQRKVLHDRDQNVYFSGEVVVLVDRFSASGAEILAGALQDYGRALVVGTGPTHGKGTVQMMIDLDAAVGNRGRPLGVLKLTVQQYFLVDGESTQQRGVLPDVVLPDPVSYVESGERYLDNAIPWTSIEALQHAPWSGASWKTDQLVAASKQRQSGLEVFSTLEARSQHMARRSEETSLPLQKAAWDAHQKADEEALEKLDPKLDEQPAQLGVQVVEYRPGPKASPKASAPDAGKDTGKRIEGWRKTLARDPWVIESLHLLEDMGAKR